MVKIEEIPSDDEHDVPVRRRPVHPAKSTSKPQPSTPSPCSCCPSSTFNNKEADTKATEAPSSSSSSTNACGKAPLSKELYDRLGANFTDSLAEIDAHYREKLRDFTTDEIIAAIRIKQGHPEMTPKLSTLRNIIHAYKILSDQKTREQYHQTGEDIPSEDENDPVEEIRAKPAAKVTPVSTSPAPSPKPVAVKAQPAEPIKKLSPEEIAELEEGVKIDFCPQPAASTKKSNTSSPSPAANILRVDETKRKQNDELRQREQAYAEQRMNETKRSDEERKRQNEQSKEKQWEKQRDRLHQKLEEKGDDLLAFLDADRFGKKKNSLSAS